MSSDRTAYFRRSAWLVTAVATTSLAAGCGSGYDDGLTKFPVTGTVLVDGEPQGGVVVRLFRDGRPGESNADTPAAVTDEEGQFVLSTNGDGDGAVAGTYKVTFFWKEGNGPGMPNLLGGQYGKLDKTPFEVTIVEGENELPPFELKRAEPAAKPRAERPAGLPRTRGRSR